MAPEEEDAGEGRDRRYEEQCRNVAPADLGDRPIGGVIPDHVEHQGAKHRAGRHTETEDDETPPRPP